MPPGGDPGHGQGGPPPTRGGLLAAASTALPSCLSQQKEYVHSQGAPPWTKWQPTGESPGENTDRCGPKIYKIQLTKAATINPKMLQHFIMGQQSHDNTVLTALMVLDAKALNVVICMEPAMKYSFKVRSFFTGCETKDIGLGIVLWRGYFQINVKLGGINTIPDPQSVSILMNLMIMMGMIRAPSLSDVAEGGPLFWLDILERDHRRPWRNGSDGVSKGQLKFQEVLDFGRTESSMSAVSRVKSFSGGMQET
ncbi:hypothetical protein EDC04DRAFT_2612769 [Pisolithus marmoratus]|nr:hypothetical protein EDC04DRAFT_2612769 [Pisolithus marmoratus]